MTTPVPTAGGRPGLLQIRDVSLFVEVDGHGYPLVVMHGGPGADHYSMLPFPRYTDRFTVILYDHRCNGRSRGAPVTSMTWENLTADADALRQKLGFARWAVLGHSFGGHVALEYALRYPAALSHLVLLDTAGDSHWARQNAADVLAKRGYRPEKVELTRRWFNGEIAPADMFRIFMRIGGAYNHHLGWWVVRELIHGGWRSKMQGDALVFGGRHLLKDWTVMDRLGEIAVPTLVIAGRDDFLFPPECQRGWRMGFRTRAGRSSNAPATTRIRSRPPRSGRLSQTSSARLTLACPDNAQPGTASRRPGRSPPAAGKVPGGHRDDLGVPPQSGRS